MDGALGRGNAGTSRSGSTPGGGGHSTGRRRAGEHELACRATDAAGETCSRSRRPGTTRGWATTSSSGSRRHRSRMIRIEREQVFPVPVEQGFAVITDIGNWPSYWPGLVRIEPDSRWGSPGDQARLIVRLLGREVELAMTLREFVPNELVALRQHRRLASRARDHERHFRSVDGGFAYRIVVAYEPRTGAARAARQVSRPPRRRPRRAGDDAEPRAGARRLTGQTCASSRSSGRGTREGSSAPTSDAAEWILRPLRVPTKRRSCCSTGRPRQAGCCWKVRNEPELAARVEDTLDARDAESPDQLVLEVGDAHVEAQSLHVRPGEVGAEARPLDARLKSPSSPSSQRPATRSPRPSGPNLRERSRSPGRRRSARSRCARRRGRVPGARPGPRARAGR